MLLAFSVDYFALIYTLLFCIYLIIAYLIIISTRLESLFKQGSTWQIRAAQIILSFIIAYILAQGTQSLIDALQF